MQWRLFLFVCQEEGIEFWYIDLWSSVYTWGATSIPEEGDFIVVPKGQVLLVDTDTPILKMLLIQGAIKFVLVRQITY